MEVNDWIKSHLPFGKNAEKLLFNCRLILSELMTNAIKHSAVETVVFECSVGADAIVIKKKEQGKRFFLVDQLKDAVGSAKSDKITLAKDKRYGLFAIAKSDSVIEFQIEEYKGNENQVIGALEHFGLIIIAKCSHNFTYEFDHATLTNTFIAKIEL